MDGQKNIKALLSKIFGIVSAVSSLCAGGFPFGVAAIVLSVLAKKTDPDNGDAKLGMILGIVGIVITLIAAVIYFILGFLGGYLEAAGY
ncbi:MAG: hypothetical protein IKO32_12965 [Lachnospiraceae bacterium]|nr:hypothetical protein [Lachnospiraceae bacterium]